MRFTREILCIKGRRHTQNTSVADPDSLNSLNQDPAFHENPVLDPEILMTIN
jgi:hypothetical protein